jgi:AcrR family transcriptional regulator
MERPTTAGRGQAASEQAGGGVDAGGAPALDALEWLWQRDHAPDGHTSRCPSCRTPRRFHRVSGRRAYACDHCGRQVYPTAATLFRGSTIPLETWFAAVAELHRNPTLPSGQLATVLGIPSRTAARIRARIKSVHAAQEDDAELLADIATRFHRGEGPPPVQTEARGQLDRIRAAASRVVARRGMAATRMVDIAREAGVSPAIIHYYFKSREAVLLAALYWASEQWQARVNDPRSRSLDPVSRLRQVINESVPTNPDQRDEYFVWLDAWVASRTYTRFLPACSAISRSWTILVASILADGEAAGVFRLAASPSEVAQRFVSLANDLGFRCVVGYEEMPPPAARRILTRFAAEQVGLDYEALA